MESTNGSWPGKLPHLVHDNQAPAEKPNLRELMASHTTTPASAYSLAAKAQKTYAYIGAGFSDKNAISLIDAKAVFNIPQVAQDYLSQMQPHEENNIYTNIIGEESLLAALEKNGQKQNLFYSKKENIVITAGAANGFYALCQTLCEPGDIILTLAPSYILFSHAVRTFGAELVLVPAEHNGSYFSVSPAALERKVSDLKRNGKKIKALLIVNPTNIDSRCWLADEIGQLAPVINRHNLLVIEDRVYDGLQYDRPEGHAFFANHPLLAARTVTLDSVSKRYGATQWRTGWIYAPKNLADAVRSAVMQTVWSPNALFQKASAILISDKDNASSNYLTVTQAEYKLRRDLCLFIINGRDRYSQLDRELFTPISSLEKFAQDNNFYLPEFDNGIDGWETPIIPQCGMFLLLQANEGLMALFPPEYIDHDLILARLIYLKAQSVILPPCELTLPESYNLFRMEFGIKLEDLVEFFSRLKDFTDNILAMDDTERQEIIAQALNDIQDPVSPGLTRINLR